MVAEVDEQHAAVVADPVAPAGQPDVGTDVGFAQGAAGVGAVAVHGRRLSGAWARDGRGAGPRGPRRSAWRPGLCQIRRRGPDAAPVAGGEPPRGTADPIAADR